MKIKVFNPVNGHLVADNPPGISFGQVRSGKHCSSPVLIKPSKTVENNFLEMKLFLQNNGGLNDTNFGYFLSDNFSSGIDHSNMLSNHFSLASGVSDILYSAVSGPSIRLSGGQPSDYIWLDIQPGQYETGSTSTINYRFVFDYN